MSPENDRVDEPDEPVLFKADLIPDAALRDRKKDALKHDAVARVVADLVRQVETPANVALFGPWGSGKSSLYGMVEDRVKEDRKGTALVRYDAWKFGGSSLHRNFLAHVTKELKLTDRDQARVNGSIETSRLRLGRYMVRNFGSLTIAFAVALFVGAAWTLLSAWAAHKWGVGVNAPIKFKPALGKALPSGGVVFGAVIAGLLLSNQSLASAVEKRTKPPLQEADQFFGAFERMMDRITRPRWLWFKHKQNDRLVVFIDELDRCQPSDVARTLTDLLTFLDHKKCVFVVAADREVLEEALDSAPQAKPIREGEPYYSTSGAFLDKVFQHQMSLPPTRPEALTVFAHDLADKQGGIWEELREQSSVTYEDVLYSLVPTHIRSPRRTKVLMNNFATNVRVIQSRDMPSADRVVQIAVLTVLQTEFPSIVRDMLRQPRLLEALVGAYQDTNEELNALVESYDPGSGEAGEVESDDHATPSPLLTDVKDDVEAERAKETRARQRLNEQLHAYLGKIHAANIDLPTPDLVYAQRAAHADGLNDEDLARVLDVAADTSPELVLKAFDEADATVSDRKAAVRFLVAQLGNNFGPSRANLVESACRLSLTLDLLSAKETARTAASTLLHEARSGRWRPASTLGALRLGLLDDGMGNPLDILSEADQLEDLFPGDVLLALTKYLPEVGERASLAFPLLGLAYDASPEAVHEAIRTWPASVATDFWGQVENHVTEWFEQTAPPTPAADPASGVAPAKTAAEVETEEVAQAARIQAVEERYSALIAAVVDRDSNDTSQIVYGVAWIGLMHEHTPSLHALLVEARGDLYEACPDPQVRTEFALEALRYTPADEWADWAEWLEDGAVPEGDTALHVAKRIASRITDGSSSADKAALAELFARLVVWLSSTQAENAAQVLWDGLIEYPPDGGAPTRDLRAAVRRALRALDRVHPDPGYVDGYMVASLVNAVENGKVLAGTGDAFVSEVGLLPPEKAAFLDNKIVEIGQVIEQGVHLNDAASVARIRIAARQRGEMKSLPAADLLATSPEAGDKVLDDWCATVPSRPDFITVARKALPSDSALRQYASDKHNVAEVSKIWIALEKAKVSNNSLASVGMAGVNDTVVGHMRQRIVGTTLNLQSDAVERLLTANLAANPKAKSAAHDLAEELLEPLGNGTGRNAARVVIAANGGDPKRKKELRASFDGLLNAYPGALLSGERQDLYRYGLLSPVKSGPLAKLFKFLPKGK